MPAEDKSPLYTDLSGAPLAERGQEPRSGRGEVHRIITEPHSGCGNWEQSSCNQWKCVHAPRSEQRAPNQFRFKQHPRADEHGADRRTNPHRWIRPMRAPAPDALIWHRRDALDLASASISLTEAIMSAMRRTSLRHS